MLLKKILITLTIIILSSCKSYIANEYFKSVGIYDIKIKLEKLSNNNKEIVLFGMHHFGKDEFYNDVKTKVDSLIKKDYFFFVEGVNSQFSGKTNLTKEDSVVLFDLAYKFRKINGKPLISEKLNTDYLSFFKEHGIRIKENLIKQPSYLEFGLSEINSKNTDLSIEKILENYEKKYGKIVLESCDFDTKFYEKSTCSKKPDKKIYDEMMMQDRSKSVISHVLTENKSKIAIIYGKAHFVGIKDSLQKLGYKVTN
ncbi:hypothetical protein [Flavobacterium facile]|uniref:hypothetical protein n=1 Tax=Flavobacterium facile TaxID=2893174 RepID=UPI002E759FB6|nr:hypothetical protein [Flavobacterium sp. T-12]